MNRAYNLPPTFQISFSKPDRFTYLLTTSQVLPVPLKKAFSFFEKPENLTEITPDWLDFSFDNKGIQSRTYQGAEFHYTIRWFAFRIQWHTRITEYRLHEVFTDEQVKGPYVRWKHVHAFSQLPEGTLMQDAVSYRIPFGILGRITHHLVIKKQLQDIFSYRAIRITEWADGNFRSKLSSYAHS